MRGRNFSCGLPPGAADNEEGVVKRKPLAVLALFTGLLLVAGPLSAHHAGSLYDRENPITLTGTVTEFEFANPHVRVRFDVKNEKGEVSHWVAETAPPQRMFQAGWNRFSLKPGDTITVSGFPAKDGQKKMGVQRLQPPKGTSDLTLGNE